MKQLQGILAVTGRVLLCIIFLMAAVGSKIPHFSDVAQVMASKGIPQPKLMLAGAIVFLLAGSLSVMTGYRARIGASLLLVFLVLATYYFHNFWAIADAKAQQEQLMHFMKNLSIVGAMLFIIANGPGPMIIISVKQK
ncbi:MAG: DoxX family protein [Planctomycetota bacterium]